MKYKLSSLEKREFAKKMIVIMIGALIRRVTYADTWMHKRTVRHLITVTDFISLLHEDLENVLRFSSGLLYVIKAQSLK